MSLLVWPLLVFGVGTCVILDVVLAGGGQMVIIVIRWNLIHAIVLEDLADVYVSSAVL